MKLNGELVEEYSGQYKSVNEYAEALRQWMLYMYHIQSVHSTFPFFVANLQAQNSQNVVPNIEITNSHGIGSVNRNNQNGFQQPPEQQTLRQGFECIIPPIWKRFVAEMIDFLLLFIIKLGVTYIAVDAFDLLEDVEKYDLETLSTDIISDYKAALNMTSDILFLELIHRIGTCVFEALCLHRGPAGLGGATPGKRVMGLRVVRCEFAAPVIGDRIIVYPSTDLGINRAVIRSVVKNLSLTFLFPVCFTLFSFQHNRTIYDIFSGSIVVQDTIRRPQLINNNNNNNNNN